MWLHDSFRNPRQQSHPLYGSTWEWISCKLDSISGPSARALATPTPLKCITHHWRWSSRSWAARSACWTGASPPTATHRWPPGRASHRRRTSSGASSPPGVRALRAAVPSTGSRCAGSGRPSAALRTRSARGAPATCWRTPCCRTGIRWAARRRPSRRPDCGWPSTWRFRRGSSDRWRPGRAVCGRTGLVVVLWGTCDSREHLPAVRQQMGETGGAHQVAHLTLGGLVRWEQNGIELECNAMESRHGRMKHGHRALTKVFCSLLFIAQQWSQKYPPQPHSY